MRKRLMIALPIFLALFLISFAFAEKTRTKYHTIYEEQPCVFVTETGDCYHAYGCGYLRQSRIPQGLYQAKSRGYRRCSVCHGRAYGGVQVEVEEAYEVRAPFFAILLSCGNALFLTPFLYVPTVKLLGRTKRPPP